MPSLGEGTVEPHVLARLNDSNFAESRAGRPCKLQPVGLPLDAQIFDPKKVANDPRLTPNIF